MTRSTSASTLGSRVDRERRCSVRPVSEKMAPLRAEIEGDSFGGWLADVDAIGCIIELEKIAQASDGLRTAKHQITMRQ